MDAKELLRLTLALMNDADVPTEEKLAVLETAAKLIRERAEEEAKFGPRPRGNPTARG